MASWEKFLGRRGIIYILQAFKGCCREKFLLRGMAPNPLTYLSTPGYFVWQCQWFWLVFVNVFSASNSGSSALSPNHFYSLQHLYYPSPPCKLMKCVLEFQLLKLFWVSRNVPLKKLGSVFIAPTITSVLSGRLLMTTTLWNKIRDRCNIYLKMVFS